jgi:ribosome biogenesis protein SLX9
VPYSKSHERRVKRKVQEQIGNGLSEIEAALPESVRLAQTIDSTMDDTSIAPPSRHQQGIIGEGKNATLSRAQRKRALLVLVSSI